MFLPFKKKRLAVSFDAARIAAELEAIDDGEWIFHGFHNTGHRVLPLLSTNGTIRNPDGSYNHSLVPPFLPTPYLERLPYLRSVIEAFGAKPGRTRLAELRPGEVISPHRDLHPNWYDKVRLHVPIYTDPGATCHIWSDSPELKPDDYESWHMGAGEAWVFNTWYVHAVTNFSDRPRLHLIIDFRPEGKLFEMMFGDASREEILSCMSFSYPEVYRTDRGTLTWLSGGVPEVGRRLWNVDVQERNPQVAGYVHPEAFWDPAAYAAGQPAA